MKKYLAGLLTGLILATTTFAFAANPIKLLVNGKAIQSDVPPQVINGRTMVPARFLAEALGAKVQWDAANNAVVVTSDSGGTPTDLPPVQNQVTTPPQSAGTSTAPPPNDQVPYPKPTTNDTSGDWISLRDLAEKHGVFVKVGEMVTLQKGEKKIEFTRPNSLPKGQSLIINVTPTLKGKMDYSLLYLLIIDLQNQGFM